MVSLEKYNAAFLALEQAEAIRDDNDPDLEGKKTNVTGVVVRLFYSKPGFTAGRLETHEGDVIPFAGPVFFNEDDFVTLFGHWEKVPKWGKQFKAASFEYAGGGTARLDPAGLAHYLASSKEFKKIGPKKAQIIADAFGERFADALETEPEEIAKRAGLPLDAVLAVRETWRKNITRNGTATWLASFSLTAGQIDKIIDAYGNNTRKILEDDPYRMIEVIDGFGFARVDEIAQKMGFAKDHPSRLRAGVRHQTGQELDQGHTWTLRSELIRKANDLLTLDQLDSMKRIETELDWMIQNGDLSQTLHQDDTDRPLVSLPMMLKMERDLEKWFRGGDASRNPNFPTEVIEPEQSGLTIDQWSAVRFSMNGQLVVITGGAGSGKTFTIRTIVSEYHKRGKRAIALCAPTGKAARRITESVGHPASTIHRLLGYRGTDWEHNWMNPLRVDLLVVDEMSMVDVSLAWRLFQAVDWSKTAVVLVGDHNQLPPIGPGNPLRDLLNTQIVPVCYLTKVHRQAGELKENSLAILDGKVPNPPRKRGEPGAPWYVMDSVNLKDEKYCQQAIVATVENRLEHLRDASGEPFDLLRDVQILTPTHKGVLGTKELNIELQRVFQRKLYGVETERPEEGKRPAFIIGDKIIQTKNDYKLGTNGVMNGTIGYIVNVEDNGTLIVEFDGETDPVSIPKKEGKQSNLMHAYALTIHKMQGSEVPCVIVITHKCHSFQQHQAMLYTGVTRAKVTAIIIGDSWGIRNAAEKRLVERRRTFLSLTSSKRRIPILDLGPEAIEDETGETASATVGMDAEEASGGTADDWDA